MRADQPDTLFCDGLLEGTLPVTSQEAEVHPWIDQPKLRLRNTSGRGVPRVATVARYLRFNVTCTR